MTNIFSPYDASAVAPNELLQKRLQIKALINKLDHKINTEQMQKLNYEADGKGKAPAMIGQRILRKNNYFDSDN